MSDKIRVGSVCELISGSPKMVVAGIDSYDNVMVAYCVNGIIHDAKVPKCVLRVVPTENLEQDNTAIKEFLKRWHNGFVDGKNENKLKGELLSLFDPESFVYTETHNYVHGPDYLISYPNNFRGHVGVYRFDHQTQTLSD